MDFRKINEPRLDDAVDGSVVVRQRIVVLHLERHRRVGQNRDLDFDRIELRIEYGRGVGAQFDLDEFGQVSEKTLLFLFLVGYRIAGSDRWKFVNLSPIDRLQFFLEQFLFVRDLFVDVLTGAKKQRKKEQYRNYFSHIRVRNKCCLGGLKIQF